MFNSTKKHKLRCGQVTGGLGTGTARADAPVSSWAEHRTAQVSHDLQRPWEGSLVWSLSPSSVTFWPTRWEPGLAGKEPRAESLWEWPWSPGPWGQPAQRVSTTQAGVGCASDTREPLEQDLDTKRHRLWETTETQWDHAAQEKRENRTPEVAVRRASSVAKAGGASPSRYVAMTIINKD